jgi:hypothetical protein
MGIQGNPAVGWRLCFAAPLWLVLVQAAQQQVLAAQLELELHQQGPGRHSWRE